MPTLPDEFSLVLQATAFAARAHRHQIRKDARTPYVSHPFRVCMILRELLGVADPECLATALLHDTIEDTTTDYDDIREAFGPNVARWVALLTKDKRMEEDAREEAYFATLAQSVWQVHLCKLADIADNLYDSDSLSPLDRRRYLMRSRQCLLRMNESLQPEARHAFNIVLRLLEEREALG